MNILVLGGTRFIGLWLVRQLHEAGHQITVVHRGEARSGQPDAPLPDGVRRLHADHTALTEIASELRALDPQVAIHMNAGTAQHAWSAAQALGAWVPRLVVISSVDVYRPFGLLHRSEEGPLSEGVLTEDSPLRRVIHPFRHSRAIPHGDSDHPAVIRRRDYDKIIVENMLRGALGDRCSVLRLPAVYGPRDYQRRLGGHLRRMDDGRPFILLDPTHAAWCWTRGYVEDVAHAIAAVASHPAAAGGTFHVGQPEVLSVAEWVARVGRLVGWAGEVRLLDRERLPPDMRSEADLRHHLVLDTAKIRRELDYSELHSLDVGLRRSIAWEREQPPLDPPDYAAEDIAVDAAVERAVSAEGLR